MAVAKARAAIDFKAAHIDFKAAQRTLVEDSVQSVKSITVSRAGKHPATASLYELCSVCTHRLNVNQSIPRVCGKRLDIVVTRAIPVRKRNRIVVRPQPGRALGFCSNANQHKKKKRIPHSLRTTSHHFIHSTSKTLHKHRRADKCMPPRIVKSREDSLITNAQDSIHQKMFSATKKLRPNGYQPPPLNTPSAILRRPQAPF